MFSTSLRQFLPGALGCMNVAVALTVALIAAGRRPVVADGRRWEGRVPVLVLRSRRPV
jgi:hypothetical protein